MSQESVNRLLADLHAERVRTWDPKQLKGNIDQRALLMATADRAGFVQVGDGVAGFNLEEVDGELLTLDNLVSEGPVVLIFFRFAGCPACNIALPYYQRTLAPALRALGARLVAVSPQVPEKLVDIKRRHGFTFEVATDRDNALGRRFGITFESEPASQAAAKARGNFIGDTTGTGTGELPMPAVVVIDQDHTVRFADISPDWLVRSEAEPVIAAVQSILMVPAQ
jgi:peroxiredoxin